MRIFYRLLLIVITGYVINSCNSNSMINRTTSRIGRLNTNCMESRSWDTIEKKYSCKKIPNSDSVLNEGLKSIRNQPFETKVLYFHEGPTELIAVDNISVRYVFNPEYSYDILDGYSNSLSEENKIRIRNRIQKIILDYQCKEGKAEAIELMKNE